MIGLRLLATCAGFAGAMAAAAQGVWDDPFESTRRAFHRAAWTFHAGTEHLLGTPSSWNSNWIVNRGTDNAPLPDTLHFGILQARPNTGWALGMGHVWMNDEDALADRVLAQLTVSKRRTEERFLGLLGTPGLGDSLVFDERVRNASALAVSGELCAHVAKSTGPDGFVEWTTGIRSTYHLVQDSLGADPSLFTPVALPRWHVAWTLGVGAGAKVWRGRMLRFNVAADALQLFKAPTPDVFRPRSAGVSGVDWVQGSYRPMRVTVSLDMYRRKPNVGCAAPTKSDRSWNLFDPKMKGAGRAKQKGLDKALKNRAEADEDDWR
jgi:hypothetical protein